MPANVEIKASIPNFKDLQAKAEKLSDTPLEILKQEDTFYNCSAGRLKLRQIENVRSELIFYKRADQKGPKFSEFHHSNVEDPITMKTVLEQAYGVKGVVKKTRYLYLVGQTRVHVDEVKGLGEFMELEVKMNPGQTVEEGEKIAKDLMQKLGVKEENLIDGAYMDLILQKTNGH